MEELCFLSRRSNTLPPRLLDRSRSFWLWAISGGTDGEIQGSQSLALLGALDLGDPTQTAILVGHSYGGAVVARMAMEANPWIRSIVIVAGSVGPEWERSK